MSASLIETFRMIAFRTYDHLGKGRRFDHQPLEETFTDINILELKERHGTEIYCHIFNKLKEGANGADWEWWLTNASKSSWLSLRVQAKVLHLKSNTFPHLHYKSGKTKEFQSAKLKRVSAKDGHIPLYCLYVHNEGRPPNLFPKPLRLCRRFIINPPESYGCSIVSVRHVEHLRSSGELNDLNSVMTEAPWHCLVCCSCFGGSDLPSRAWNLIRHSFDIKKHGSVDRKISGKRENPPIGPRPDAPPYVYAAMEGGEGDTIPSGVRGVVIIVEKHQQTHVPSSGT